MVTLNRKLILESRTIEIRRAGIKIRTYENARVFLEGTAGRGASHWAARDFTKCHSTADTITYFSGDGNRPAIAAHGNHIHVFNRDKSGFLVQPDTGTAEKEATTFITGLQRRGIRISIR